jgi:folate-dependent phosphoribosylglycinamide formyltransferase PurN
MYQFGWFSTGRDKAARDLLEVAYNSKKQGEIEAELAFVFCNREPGESAQSDLFLKLVECYGIPLVCFSYQKFKTGRASSQQGEALPRWRLDYDREVMKRLKAFHPDLCVLAGYMLIVGKEMCSKYDMLNLHPAAPGGPAGTWQEVIWQLVERKAKETGVMMHLVTPELDSGPVVSYCTFPIAGALFDSFWHEIEGQSIDEIKRQQDENNSLFKLIRQHGLKREFPLILATMKAFSQGRMKIIDGKVTDSQGKAINGYNLTDEINKLVKGAHQS